MVTVNKPNLVRQETYIADNKKYNTTSETKPDEALLRSSYKKLSEIIGNRRTRTLADLYSMGCYAVNLQVYCLAENTQTNPIAKKENS